MLNVSLLFILWVVVVAGCNPGESVFQLYIIYLGDSSSQSLDVIDMETGTTRYSYNGYGKDNTVDIQGLCLKSTRYKVIVRDGLRDSWPAGSYFDISAEFVFSMLQGSCDFGGYQEYEFYPYTPLPLHSDWLFSDILQENWYSPDFDDSTWFVSHHGEFPLYSTSRFYRIHLSLNEEALSYSSAVLLGLHGRNLTTLYLNGELLFDNKNTTILITDTHEYHKSENFFTYSFPISFIHSSSLVLAITTSSLNPTPIEDVFDFTLSFIPIQSNRIYNALTTSAHSVDFYRNPLSNAFDHNRGSFWRMNGCSSDVWIDFPNHIEYITTLTLTSGNDHHYAPTKIIIEGCTDMTCIVLGKQDNIVWNGAYETHSMILNEGKQSYSLFHILFETHENEIRISEIALSSQFTPSSSLSYQNSNSTWVLHSSFLSIFPHDSIFTDFFIEPSLPDGILFSTETGAIIGIPHSLPIPTAYTISALSLYSKQKVTTTLLLRILDCSNQFLLKIESSSLLWSHYESWSLTDSHGSVIASEQGLNCGTIPINRFSYLCLSEDSYTIKLSTKNPFSYSRGAVKLFSSFNSFYKSIAILSFHDSLNPFTFSTASVIPSTSSCHVNTDYHMDRYWYTAQYTEDSHWVESSLDNLPSSTYVSIRFWKEFSIQDMEALLLHVSSSCRFVLYCNGAYTLDRPSYIMRDGISIKITSDTFNNGMNLFAIRLYCDNPTSFNLQGYTLSDSVNSLNNQNVLIESDETMSSSSPSYVMDGLLSTDWVGVMKKQEISLKFSFNPQYAQTVNSFCITNSLKDLNTDPSSWKLRGKFSDDKWYLLSTYSKIYFQGLGEKRCFVVPSLYKNSVFIGIQFDFQQRKGQEYLAISEISFHTTSYNNKILPPFSYGISSIDLIKKIDFPVTTTPSYLYFNYWSDDLPDGLILDSMNGHIEGKVTTSLIDYEIKIYAESFTGEIVSTSLILNTRECEDPFSLIEIQFADIEDISYFLSFQLYQDSPLQLLASTQVLPSSSSQSYFFCINKGLYFLKFIDQSNSGFLKAKYFLHVDQIEIQQGIFNPGFSSFQTPFAAGYFFNPHSLWYYSFDNTDPPSNWYSFIDPVHETWEVAYPNEFPIPQGHTQYFKTVVEMSHSSFTLTRFVSFIIRFTVKGGAVLYFNKQEVLRHALPTGLLTKETLPLSSFQSWQTLKVTIPIQFTSSTEPVIPIAIELHDEAIQTKSLFTLSITLQPDNTICQLHPSIDYSEPDLVEHPTHLYDLQYYNKVTFHHSNQVHIIFDLQHHEYSYITKFCLFSGDSPDEYPHSIIFYGGILDYLKNATIWKELYSNDDVSIQHNFYGNSRCFHFYNTESFSRFQFVLSGGKQKNEMEIAEVQLLAQRLDHSCEVTINGTIHYTPNQQWSPFACPPYYFGKIMIFCNNGNWTDRINNCIPVGPQAFHYEKNVYIIRRRDYVKMVPSVIGAELHYEISMIPEGMKFNETTGILEGNYNEKELSLTLYVRVMNAGGMQETSIGIFIMNSHEELFFIIAILFVVLLIGIIVCAYQMIHRNTEQAMKEAELCHLHTKELPKNLLPLLV